MPRATQVWASLLGGVLLLPLVPGALLPLGDQRPRPGPAVPSYAVPTFFSTAADLAPIPASSPVLIYPYSTAGVMSYSVLWQAVAAERFKLTSGDVTYRGDDGQGVPEGPPLDPPQLEQLLVDAYSGAGPLRAERLSAATLERARRALVRYGFSTVIVAPVGASPRALVSAITIALGRRPTYRGGVDVWYGVQRDCRAVGSA